MTMKKKIIYYICIILGLLALSYAFVPQVLGGKIVNQSDISGWQGMSHEMMEWNSAHPDDQTAWTQSMFGGMPTTTIHASTKGDWTQALYDILLIGRRPATYLFISLIGAWLLMLAMGIHPLIAVGGAIAITFCSYNLQIIQVGHNTKMQAIAFLPWVLAALVYTYRSLSKKRWLLHIGLGASLFALALSFQVKANHPQITYYLAILILIFAVIEFIHLLANKECRSLIGRFGAASALLLVLGCTGIATNAIKLLPTYEYTPYSIRGGSSEKSDGNKASEGLDINYATAWSYGLEELPNLLIPNFNGGSSAGAVNPKKSATYELLKSAGQTNLKEISQNLPLYWGPQPFTAGPMYMGAVTIFLFVLGLFAYNDKSKKWWLLIATILAICLALGNHFMWFTKLFYDYAPFYNKFRTVSMALVVLQITLPLLAFLTLDNIVKSDIPNKQVQSKIKISALITGTICLLFALIPSIAGSFTGSADAGQPEILVDALRQDRIHLLRVDAWRSLAFIVASALILLWGCSIPKGAEKTFETQPAMRLNRRRTASLLICILILVDLFPIATRYLNSDDFITPKNFQNQFALRPVDEFILEDQDPSYRVLDLTVNVFNDSHPSYWHKNIGGYSPAKLQRYQEFIESDLTAEINTLYKAISGAKTIDEAEELLPYLDGLAKMNCRYIIIDENAPALRYPYAKGNAWFSANEDESSVIMTDYAPNCQRYSYSSPTGGKMVFSEVYYPAGWTLTVEDTGEVIPIELEDKLLRSAKVPAGKHTLVMRFDPPSYSLGETISRISSIIILLTVLVAGVVFFILRKDK